jgi:hypothetical protein
MDSEEKRKSLNKSFCVMWHYLQIVFFANFDIFW